MHWVTLDRPLFHEVAEIGWEPSSTLAFPVYQAVSQITNHYGKVGLKLFHWKQNCGVAFLDMQKRQLLFKCLRLEMPPPRIPPTLPRAPTFTWLAAAMISPDAGPPGTSTGAPQVHAISLTSRGTLGCPEPISELLIYQWHRSTEAQEMFSMKLL